MSMSSSLLASSGNSLVSKLVCSLLGWQTDFCITSFWAVGRVLADLLMQARVICPFFLHFHHSASLNHSLDQNVVLHNGNMAVWFPSVLGIWEFLGCIDSDNS